MSSALWFLKQQHAQDDVWSWRKNVCYFLIKLKTIVTYLNVFVFIQLQMTPSYFTTFRHLYDPFSRVNEQEQVRFAVFQRSAKSKLISNIFAKSTVKCALPAGGMPQTWIPERQSPQWCKFVGSCSVPLRFSSPCC